MKLIEILTNVIILRITLLSYVVLVLKRNS
nr:MAG TPA: hypothetical protein [Caudoviricetes sp.]